MAKKRKPKNYEERDSRRPDDDKKFRNKGRGGKPNPRGNGNPRNSGNTISRGLYATDRYGENDISWYTRNPELISVAARIAMPYRPGVEIDLGETEVTVGTSSTTIHPHMQVPGVMALHWIPSIGYSNTPNSPASICAARMWAQVRSKFSSDLAADPPDLFMYVYALGNLHAYIERLKRLYRTINTYSRDNYDFPMRVLAAQLPSSTPAATDRLIQEFRTRRLEFYGRINELVNAANVFRIPDQYPILHRMRWMNEHVYMDENRANAQTYLFVQDVVYTIDDTGETGTRLVPTASWQGIATFDSIINKGFELLTNLQNWEDAYTINGYFQRAWEDSPTYQSSLLGESEILIPVYVPEVLEQIENSIVCPASLVWEVGGLDYPAPFIEQDPNTNTIVCDLEAEPGQSLNTYLLNLHESTSEADAIVATRLMSWFDKLPLSGNKHKLIAGSEIITNIWIHWDNARLGYNTMNIGPDGIRMIVHSGSPTDSTVYAQLRSFFAAIALNYWKHHPIVFARLETLRNLEAGSESVRWLDSHGLMPLCDLDQITTVDRDWLENLHRVVFYSLFNVFSRGDKVGSPYD